MSQAEPDPATLKLVANERTKLTATYMNGIAIAIFAVGGFAPFITTALSRDGHFAPVLAVMVVCLVMSGGIHWAARQSLQDLRP